MRFYDIQIFDKPGGTLVWRRTTGTDQAFDANALSVEFDFIVGPLATPVGNASVAVNGVSLDEIRQAQDFANKYLTLYAGMAGGLPLAKPARTGLILAGTIYQSFANWIGTDMQLDFVVVPSGIAPDASANFSFVWDKGKLLSDAINTTLTTAFGNYPITINTQLSDSWIAPETVPAQYDTLESFAGWLASQTPPTSKLDNIRMVIQGTHLYVSDGSATPTKVQIAATDLVGQPTWIEFLTAQVTTVLRPDITWGNQIVMPRNFVNAPGLATTTANSQPSSGSNMVTFALPMTVIAVRHIGNSRSADSGEWVTVINAITNATGSSPGA